MVAIFDVDRERVGTEIGTLKVRHKADLNTVVEEQDILVAVLAVPSAAAQELADELRQMVEDEDIVVGVLAVPGEAAQGLAGELVEAGVKIIFNYSESLLDVPPEVTVHTSSPAVDLLYALYFYLT